MNNISEDTTEFALVMLFQPFGLISRVYIAMDIPKDKKKPIKSRGFAFVSFVDQEDALSAMAELQGHRYDCMILKLEWERPRAQKCEWSTTCGEGERFMPLSKNNIVAVFFVTFRCHPSLSPLTRRPPEGQHVWNDE